MLPPDYLRRLPDALVKLYAQAEEDILADMARRISAYDYWIPAAEHQRRALAEMGAVREDVLRELSRRTGRAVRELKRLMEEAAWKSLDHDEGIYRAHGLDPPPLNASPELQKVLAAGLRQTKGLFQNLTGTTARTASGQFEAALDRAWMQVSSGAFDYNAAIRTAVKDLSRQGVGAIRYPSGHVDTLETATRRAVVTGVNQTMLNVQWELCDMMGCDLVETTAHAGARPTHAVWQGQIFSRSGKSSRYPDFVSSTGFGRGDGIGGWNCGHQFNPWFEGSPRSWTPEVLESYEARGIDYNGQKLTEYEAGQQQRAIERNIRRWKRENKAMEAAGLDTSESAAKVRQWQETQKDFLRQTGLKRQAEREQIAGWGRKEAAHLQTLARKQKEEYNKAKEAARALIRSDETPKTINPGAQNKHIKTSKGYIQGRSYIYGDIETAQTLVDRYSGTGEPKLTKGLEWTHKEFVSADHPIGVLVNPETHTEIETRRFSIHYGKRGAHIVPAKEESK